jgi:hypothetical protein
MIVCKAQDIPPQLVDKVKAIGFTTSTGIVYLPDDFDFEGFTVDHLTMARGFGDYVAKLAKPIAGVIDRFFKTDLKNCKGCTERQAKLNEAFRFGNK